MTITNPFAPVAGPGGFPVPPPPWVVAERIANNNATIGNQAPNSSGSAVVTNPSSGQAGVLTGVVSTNDFNTAINNLSNRIDALAQQVNSNTGNLATGMGGYGGYGGDGGMGGMMPLMLVLLLSGGLGTGTGTGTGLLGSSTTLILLLVIMGGFGGGGGGLFGGGGYGGGGYGGGGMDSMLPLVMVLLLTNAI